MDGIWLARPVPAVGAGEPVAVKDLLDTAGLATTYGSARSSQATPTSNSSSDSSSTGRNPAASTCSSRSQPSTDAAIGPTTS